MSKYIYSGYNQWWDNHSSSITFNNDNGNGDGKQDLNVQGQASNRM